MITHLVAACLAVMIDRVIGDPRAIPHPVVGFGKLISFLDKHLNKGSERKWKGIMMLLIVCFFAFSVPFLIIFLAYQFHLYVGIIIEAWLISTTIAAKGLKKAAIEVSTPLKSGNIEEARLKLSYIVGRDTETLKEEEIARATIETVAENTSDGVTAPLFFAIIGGAPLAMLYRAVNTCDSMVGYKNERFKEFGFSSAKFDDILNWIPSRVTAFIMVFFGQPKGEKSQLECWKIVLRDARKHPSPNSGWGEAAVAALLGIQLGGLNTYNGVVSNRALMGDPLLKITNDLIEETVEIMLKTVNRFTLVFVVVGGVYYVVT